MFKNLKDKKQIYYLLALSGMCVIALMMLSLLPESKKEVPQDEVTAQIQNEESEESDLESADNLERRLKKILSKIEGAGNIDVMITFESSEEIQPAYNSNSTTETTEEKDSQGGERVVTTESENKTMITSSSNSPIILKTTEAKVKGVLVVSSGASDMKVKETLYNAVQTALQVEGHQVQIICSK